MQLQFQQQQQQVMKNFKRLCHSIHQIKKKNSTNQQRHHPLQISEDDPSLFSPESETTKLPQEFNQETKISTTNPNQTEKIEKIEKSKLIIQDDNSPKQQQQIIRKPPLSSSKTSNKNCILAVEEENKAMLKHHHSFQRTSSQTGPISKQDSKKS